MAVLEILDGPNAGARIPLTRAETLIGRYPFCDIVLDVQSVSRRHARILYDGTEYAIEDLNSINGTFVNNARLEGRHRLRDQDRVRIYRVLTRFCAEDAVDDPVRTVSIGDPSRATVDDVAVADGVLVRKQVRTIDAASSGHADVAARKQLLGLLSMISSVGSSLELETVLPRILDGLFSVFPQCRRGHILLASPKGELVLRASRQGGSETVCSETLAPVDLTIARQAFEESKAIVNTDQIEDEHASIFDFPLRSRMCAPLSGLQIGGLGVVSLETSDSSDSFDDDDLAVLVSIARVGAHAIEYSLQHQIMLNRAVELGDERRKREHAEGELNEGRVVQQRLYPSHGPEMAGFDIAGMAFPVEANCGDYFDFIPFDSGSLGIAVGDVSGHGLGPALHMVETRASLRALCQAQRSIGRILADLNRLLLHDTAEGRFVSLFFALLDSERRSLSYSAAGHCGYLLHSSGELRRLKSTGPILGVLPDVEPNCSAEVPLAAGDILLLPTDGLEETQNAKGELFGRRRMLETLRAHSRRPAREIVSTLHRTAREFAGDCRQSDDITAVVVKVC